MALQPYQFVPVPTVVTLKDLFRGHQNGLSTLDVGYLACAAHVSIFHHDGEIRDDSSDYHTHTFAVSEIVRLMGGDVFPQCIARMHDGPEHMIEKGLFERFQKTMAEIDERFPSLVKDGVLALTRFGKGEEAEKDYREQLFLANTIYPWILPIKMADCMHYLVTMQAKKLQAQKRKLDAILGPYMELYRNGLSWVADHGYHDLIHVYENGIRHIEENALYEQKRVLAELSCRLAPT